MSNQPPKVPKAFVMTPEKEAEIAALREARQAKKAAQQALKEEQAKNTPLPFLERQWIEVPCAHKSHRSTKILSWNLLAQCLVRRELFPGSDLLKQNQRLPILMQEIVYYSPDIACLQEVDKDRVIGHNKTLEPAGYDIIHETGYEKKLHGVMIAWKRDLYSVAAQKLLKLDTLSPLPGSTKTYLSRTTRNIALIVALRFSHQQGGVIVVTHHLFWHPRHYYERARQIVIILNELRQFRDTESNGEFREWPCFFAGDFNIQPDEAAYPLLVGLPLSAEQEESIISSTRIHSSVDFAAAHNNVEEEDEEEEENGMMEQKYTSVDGDEDRVLKSTRPAKEGELLDLKTLTDLFKMQHEEAIYSAYAMHHGKVEKEEKRFYAHRAGWLDKCSLSEDDKTTRGFYEPVATNATPLWTCTLDYIYCISKSPVHTTGLLKMHSMEEMAGGCPRAGIEPSDHISIMASFTF